MNRRKYWWSANNNTFVLIEDMSDQYIVNSILYVIKNYGDQHYACVSMLSLLKEYIRRPTITGNEHINVFLGRNRKMYPPRVLSAT